MDMGSLFSILNFNQQQQIMRMNHHVKQNQIEHQARREEENQKNQECQEKDTPIMVFQNPFDIDTKKD